MIDRTVILGLVGCLAFAALVRYLWRNARETEARAIEAETAKIAAWQTPPRQVLKIESPDERLKARMGVIASAKDAQRRNR